MKHKCKNKEKSAIISKWNIGDGYPEFVGKWTLDVFGFDHNRTLIIIKFCPYCGIKLK